MDVLTPEQRHRNMVNIKNRDTAPEKVVRKTLKNLGYRFTINNKDIKGKPDIVFKKIRKAIFVNGCFWHMHSCRFGKVVPKTNIVFWKNKRLKNKERDKKNNQILKGEGWKVFTFWECQLKNISKTKKNLANFIEDSK